MKTAHYESQVVNEYERRRRMSRDKQANDLDARARKAADDGFLVEANRLRDEARKLRRGR